jgi:methylglutaconyl-CoA hydratase
MSDILSTLEDHVLLVTLNRLEKHNAFDDQLLKQLQNILDKANSNPDVGVLLLKANGKSFSAGADLAWMQRMVEFSEEENFADANLLANVMHTLYHLKKPTIAMVQGAAIGGGVGLVAACDIAIASTSATFCFSEVKLGLIPAVISPYVIKAIGARVATGLFMSAETFSSQRALEINLIQHILPNDDLLSYTRRYAQQIAQWPPGAVSKAKLLVRQMESLPIDAKSQHLTASLIAKQRVSPEAQKGLKSFLNKANPA